MIDYFPPNPPLKRIYGPDEPWPFRFMEVGDKVVCLRHRAASTAHAYGASTHKNFTTESRYIDQPDGTRVRAVKVTRLPDDAHTPSRGRRKLESPWEFIPSGGTWESQVFAAEPGGSYPDGLRILRSRVYTSNLKAAQKIRVQLAQQAAEAVAEHNKTARNKITARIISYTEQDSLTTYRASVLTTRDGYGYVLRVRRQDPDTSEHMSQVQRIIAAHGVNTAAEGWE